MIELRRLKKSYENAEPLKDVSVTINDGDIGENKERLRRTIQQSLSK